MYFVFLFLVTLAYFAVILTQLIIEDNVRSSFSILLDRNLSSFEENCIQL